LILTFALGGVMLVSGSSLMLLSNPWLRPVRSPSAVSDRSSIGDRQQTASRLAVVALIGLMAIVLLAVGARGERE
jgi:hypothetical protein